LKRLLLASLLAACAGPDPGADASRDDAGRAARDAARDASAGSDTAREDAARDDAGIETPGLLDPGALEDYEGPYEIESGTVTLENVRLTGRLTVRGGTVTLRNCTSDFEDYYHVIVYGGSLLVEHCELDGMNTVASADDIGITGANITVRYSVFRRFVNAMRPASDSLLEHNVIEMPNTAFDEAHTDGIEVYGGSNIEIRSNRIDIAGGAGETGCVNIATDFGDIDDVRVEDNDFTGGTYSFYARLQGAGSSLTNVRVIGNRWHLPRVFGTHSVEPSSAVVEWTDNMDEGDPLSF
jgi:hypothetical protein